MKNLLCPLLALFMILSVFSCTSADNSSDNGKSGIDISKYSLVRPDSYSGTMSAAVKSLHQKITALTGCEIELTTDWVDRGQEIDQSKYEILVGKTNRDASAELIDILKNEETEHSYAVQFTENKIVIAGSDDESTILAIKHFISELESRSDGSSTIAFDSSYCFVDGANGDMSVFSNLSVLTYELTSIIYGPSKSNRNVELTYARILMLEHNGDKNGTLLATAESLDEDCYIIHQSTDGGENWEIISRVKAGSFGGVASWQPMIYELPVESCSMPSGTLLLAGCVRNNTSNMCIWRSYDQGKTWEEMSNVTASNGNGGVWEPFLICDEDTGNLVCFYSTENDSAHSQKLVCKVSKDGKKWGREIDVVASNTQHHRPGMITVTRLGNGQYFATYEMVGLDGTNYFKISDSLTEWDNPSDIGTQIRSSDGELSFGTPYCTWTKAGGSKGTIIMSGKFGKDGKDCGLFLSFNYGKSWTYLENPMHYTNTEGTSAHRFGYSPCFYSASDGTVYYVNCVDTEARDFSTRADMKLTVIKIR